MATSPTTKSALLSGAAKDDAVGGDGDCTFTIQDLLANDPGGAAKVDVGTQFFFGSTAADQADQAGYLLDHGITDNGDGTYTVKAGATDFDYFVQIGNKGTWSTAHVDVTAPEPACEAHAGDLLFQENFDDYTIEADHGSWGEVNLGYGGWANTQGTGAYGEVVEGVAGSIQPTSENYWLDTQNSPGGTNITNWFSDPTGGEFLLSFDIGTHAFGEGPMEETAHDATFQVLVDGQAVEGGLFKWSDFATHDEWKHVDLVVDVDTGIATDDGVSHTFSFVDTTQSQGNYVGFALDTIQVHDWIMC
jgi:hypothetical protein